MLTNKPYILVIRQLGGIGDCLSLSTVARGLREKYPNHLIKLVTSNIYLAGSLLDIAEHNPFWSEIIVIEPYEMTTENTKRVWGKWFSQNTPNIEDELLWKKADQAICLNTACVEYEWPALETPEGITKPRYQIWCEAAGVVPSSYSPIYEITKQEMKEAKNYAKRHWKNKTVIGVGLAAYDKKRAWGIDKLTQLCNQLYERGLHPVTIDPTCTIPGIEGLINKRIRYLMPLIAQMQAFISVDTGTLHMAGTVGTPVVGIFGPTDFKMRTANYYGSFIDSRKIISCAPCWYKYPCLQDNFEYKPYECLNRVSINAVIEETLRLINMV